MEKIAGLIVASGFIGLGIYFVISRKKMQRQAQAQRPKNWEKILGLNLIWTWIDDPTYTPTMILFGLIGIAAGVFILLGLLASVLPH